MYKTVALSFFSNPAIIIASLSGDNHVWKTQFWNSLSRIYSKNLTLKLPSADTLATFIVAFHVSPHSNPGAYIAEGTFIQHFFSSLKWTEYPQVLKCLLTGLESLSSTPATSKKYNFLLLINTLLSSWKKAINQSAVSETEGKRFRDSLGKVLVCYPAVADMLFSDTLFRAQKPGEGPLTKLFRQIHPHLVELAQDPRLEPVLVAYMLTYTHTSPYSAKGTCIVALCQVFDRLLKNPGTLSVFLEGFLKTSEPDYFFYYQHHSLEVRSRLLALHKPFITQLVFNFSLIQKGLTTTPFTHEKTHQLLKLLDFSLAFNNIDLNTSAFSTLKCLLDANRDLYTHQLFLHPADLIRTPNTDHNIPGTDNPVLLFLIFFNYFESDDSQLSKAQQVLLSSLFQTVKSSLISSENPHGEAVPFKTIHPALFHCVILYLNSTVGLA